MSTTLPDLRFPVGRFDAKADVPRSERTRLIESVAATPARLRAAVTGFTEAQLDTPYRDGGWSVRQVVHHVPDSHMNAYVRFKLALTEDAPTIKPYNEARWAELEDSRTTPIETSLVLLEAVHDRWDRILRAMSDADFDRPLVHPEMGNLNLWFMLRLYEWHGRHHAAHITSLREREGW
jgi:hypothetical protein